MSAASLKFLQENYPRRPALRAEEVALVLGKKDGRGALQRVRERMKNGRYPNAKKVDGIWQLPVEDLAEIMDPTPKADPSLPTASPGSAARPSGRRKSSIGPRLEFIRTALFWVHAFRAMGFMKEAQELEDQAKAMRSEGRLARDMERAEEQAAALAASTPQPTANRIHKPLRP